MYKYVNDQKMAIIFYYVIKYIFLLINVYIMYMYAYEWVCINKIYKMYERNAF